MTIVAPVKAQFDRARDYAASLAYGPLVQLARAACLTLFKRIAIGSLEITDTDDTVIQCGRPGKEGVEPHTGLRVQKDTFWVRLLLFADMLSIKNRNHVSNGSTITSTLSGSLSGLLRATNTLTTARLNIAAHYDICNAMFAAFLSPDMTYSCPIWLPRSNRAHQTESLEDAQNRKLQHFVDNAHLKPTDHVLEIGTDWGSFAIKAVQQTGCRVTSLTLSVEQKELAEERIEAAGLSSHITVLLCDYRTLPVPSPRYDKIVSIEMLEAVGAGFLSTYFSCVNALLKEDGGVAVFQCIT
ncbi:hypothetical protein LTS18_009798, partial [Coniosporium uncinatum]